MSFFRLLAHLERSLPNRCGLCQQPLRSGQGLCEICLEDHYPGPLCLGCTAPLPAPEPWRCGPCLARKRWRPVVVGYPYTSAVGRLSAAIKIQGRLSLLPPLCSALAERIQRHWAQGALPRPDALVAVPMYPGKLPVRGFNHSLLIAKELGRQLELPVREGLVEKVRATKDQHGLSGRARRHNLKGCFQVRGGSPKGEQLALVDDVITTGTTLATLAASLRKAGYQPGQYWALASAMARPALGQG